MTEPDFHPADKTIIYECLWCGTSLSGTFDNPRDFCDTYCQELYEEYQKTKGEKENG